MFRSDTRSYGVTEMAGNRGAGLGANAADAAWDLRVRPHRARMLARNSLGGRVGTPARRNNQWRTSATADSVDSRARSFAIRIGYPVMYDASGSGNG